MRFEMNEFSEQLEEMCACEDAIIWIEANDIDTVQEAWDALDRPDWMMWLVDNEYPGINVDTRLLKEIALEFAEQVLPYAGEHRQICIDTIYASWMYLDGYIDHKELSKQTIIAYIFSPTLTCFSIIDSARAAAWAAATTARFAHTAAYYLSATATRAAACLNGDISRQQADTIRKYIPDI